MLRRFIPKIARILKGYQVEVETEVKNSRGKKQVAKPGDYVIYGSDGFPKVIDRETMVSNYTEVFDEHDD